jgi:uncharacterized repeat protein (TIGR03803 family)
VSCARTFVAAAAALSVLVWASAGARAQLKVLHSFTGQDGAEPLGGVIFDGAGNLYGTTNNGGARNDGAVYQLSPNGTESVLHSFSICGASKTGCTEGNSPEGPLVMDASGNLFGTAAAGGGPGRLAGTVFMLAPNGSETTLYAFCSKTNCIDGEHPRGGLVVDAHGNLFGVTSAGGGRGMGVVYQLTAGSPQYKQTVIHSFCSSPTCTDGAFPAAGTSPAPGLIIDAAGNLYGTTSQGGAHDNGEVFELSPSDSGTYALRVLYSFCPKDDCSGGQAPNSGLLLDGAGNIYGTTARGGTGHTFQNESVGVLFRLSPHGQDFTETVLYNFCSESHCTDGALPTGSLIMDSAGVLYGTASAGGAKKAGVVFALAPNGTYAVLHDFCSDRHCADGDTPQAIVEDARGNLFGTAAKGGADKKGTVFEIAGGANPP